MSDFEIQTRKIMHHNVGVLSLGSNQAAIVLAVERKNRSIKTENAHMAAFDADDSAIFNNLPQPTDPDLETAGFASGTFKLLHTIGPDTIDAIKQGRYPGKAGFASLNQIGIANGATKGVGQSPPCGRGTLEFNYQNVAASVEGLIKSFLERRHVDAGAEGQQITIYILNGMYGGFSSGGRETFLFIVRDVIQRLGISATILEIVILPDTAATKDWLQTASIAFSGVVELSAAATGKFYTLHQQGYSNEARICTVPFATTIFIANNNDALHKPLATDRIRQSSSVANLVHLLSTTDLGSQLSKEIIDFEDDAKTTTLKGELRCAKSIGVSFISLNRERLIRHNVAKTVELSCNSLLQEKPQEAVLALAQTFFHEQHLLEGEGFNQISDGLLLHLHKNGTTRVISILERSRRLIMENLDGQTGNAAIDAARAALHHSAEILNSYAPEIEENTSNRSREVSEAFDSRLRRIIQNSDYGYRTALDFASRVKPMVEQVSAAASNELLEIEHQLEEQRNGVAQYQNELIPEVEGKGLLWKYINRDQLRSLASNACLTIANAAELELRLSAKRSALEVCESVMKHVSTRIADLTELLSILETYRGSHRKAKEYEEALDDVDICPHGHSLVSKDNIDGYYRRAIQSTSTKDHAEAQKDLVAHSLHIFFRRLGDPLSLKQTPESLESLSDVAFERLSPFINNVNVVSELLAQLPVGTEGLRSYLQERVREAEPALRLKDNDIHDNPQHTVSVIGIKGGASCPIVDEVNRYGAPKHPYTAVDTQDPDSIVFISLRSTFPVSDIVAFENWRDAYSETARHMKEEQFHRAMWRRYMPLPGANLTIQDARRYVAMAFVIGRLGHQNRGGLASLQYAEFDPNRPDTVENCRLLTMGSTIEEIRRYLQSQYSLLVEILSLFFEVDFQRFGPEYLEQKLHGLEPDVGTTEKNNLSGLVGSFITKATLAELLKQLDWLVDQATPQAMLYFKG